MASDPARFLTAEEYLALERAAEIKSEYFDGSLVAMTGATRPHVLVTVNLVRELSQQLRGRACELYALDMRVRITEANMYAYPDLVVVCGEPTFEDDEGDVLLNPTLVLEVLSPSTEGYDRGLKFARYRQRTSLQEYVLVAQDRAHVERFSREGDHWLLTEVAGLDSTIELTSIGCTLALREVYDKVTGLAYPL